MSTSFMPRVGPYSTQKTLAKLDGRRREAKLMAQTRAELIAHVGGKPSATHRAIIERAVQLGIRIAMMDAKFAASGIMTDHDSRTYLAWSSTLTRTLRELGQAAPTAKPSLQAYLRGETAR